MDTPILRCLSYLYKMAQNLHVTYEHLLRYFKSPLYYLELLIQCKCSVNSHTVIERIMRLV
jgi:hypothetical protein